MDGTEAPHKKPILATVSLAGCFGCHMSLLDADERILDVLAAFELHRSPLTDIKRFAKRCDVGLIEGGCCNDENVHVLREFRENCDVLVAVGACAINGGLPALRNEIGLEACLTEAYLEMPTGAGAEGIIPADADIPKLLDRVYPCHEVVKIDYFLPGCPPPADAFWALLTALAAGRAPDLPTELIHYD